MFSTSKILRNARGFLYGTPEESIPLFQSAKNNFSDLNDEKKEPSLGKIEHQEVSIDIETSSVLCKQLKKNIQEKINLSDNPPFTQRHSRDIFKFLVVSSIIASLSDIVCHIPNAYSMTQKMLSDWAAHNIEPEWSSLSPLCVEKAKEYLESPMDCVMTTPKLAMAGGAYIFLNELDHRDHGGPCNANITMLFWKCYVAPLESTEVMKNIGNAAWREELAILLFAWLMFGLLYRKLITYHRAISLTSSDINDLAELDRLELPISGVILSEYINPVLWAAKNTQEDKENLLYPFKLIEFSQEEIRKYKKYIDTINVTLNAFFPESLISMIIDGYLNLNNNRILLSPKAHNQENAEHWQHIHANFFRFTTGEYQQEETALPKQNSKEHTRQLSTI